MYSILLPLIPILTTALPVQAWNLEVSERHYRSFQLDGGWAVTGARYGYGSYFGPLPHGECVEREDVLLVRYRWMEEGLSYEVDRIGIGLRWYYSSSFFPLPPPIPEPFDEYAGSYRGWVEVQQGDVEAVGALWVRKSPDDPLSYLPVPVLAVHTRDGTRLLILDEQPRVLDIGRVKGPVVLTHSLLEIIQYEFNPKPTVPPARILFVDGEGNLVELDPLEGTRRTLAHLPDSARVLGWVRGGYLITAPGKTLLVTPKGEMREITLPEGWRILALPPDDYYRKDGFLVLASDDGLAVGRLDGSEVRILTPVLRVPTDARLAWLTPWHWPGQVSRWGVDSEGDPEGFLLALWRGNELIFAAWHRGSRWRVRKVALPGDIGAVVGVAIGANDRYDARSVSLAFVPDGELSVHLVTANVVSKLPKSSNPLPVLPVPAVPRRRGNRRSPV
ncbi:hypothetical protein [Methanopyrus sp.]